MNISVLASGSRGNCTLIHDDNNAILIDMGISTRKLKQAYATSACISAPYRASP